MFLLFVGCIVGAHTEAVQSNRPVGPELALQPGEAVEAHACSTWLFGMIPMQEEPDRDTVNRLLTDLTKRDLFGLVGMTVDERWFVHPFGRTRCVSVSGHRVPLVTAAPAPAP
jgi:hypothetical protein